MLEARLVEHDDLVDLFVIVEGERRFGDGARKELWLANTWSRFSRWAHKIIHIPVKYGEYPDGDGWAREHYQRSRVVDGLTGLHPDTLVAFGDVDEFPDRSQWGTVGTVGFHRHMVYAPNLEHPLREYGTVMTTVAGMGDPAHVRIERARNTPHHGGFHFSWHPGEETLAAKTVSSSHTEFAHLDADMGRQRRRSHWDDQPLTQVEPDSSWPAWFHSSCPGWWWA
jgi:hypothetical protein